MAAMTVMNDSGGAIMERVVALGDLEALKPMERAQYYARVCESVGLNPLTRPFEYVKLQGKLTLYARRDATDQLRKIHRVSVVISSREHIEGLYIVTARATTPDGRTDESTGAVSVSGKKGEDLANALMKAETKAKRRVTLSICGLGWLDETEVADVKSAKPVEVTEDGEILDHDAKLAHLEQQLSASVDWAKWAADHVVAMNDAVKDGPGALLEAWAAVNDDIKKLRPPPAYVDGLRMAKDDLKQSLRGQP
jgi:hypothetical protein